MALGERLELQHHREGATYIIAADLLHARRRPPLLHVPLRRTGRAPSQPRCPGPPLCCLAGSAS
eukprot:14705345-Heterocapsa_arctica.AAC.1